MRLAGLAAPTSIAAAMLLAAVGGGRVAAGDPSTSTAREPAGALPRISVSTQRRIRDDPKVRATVRVEGSYDGPAGIELRGQSSESFPKKSYGLELRGPNGKDVRVGLLGMAPDGDWVLQGPWTDKTLMRNALAYDLARMTGRWAAQTRHVELHLNGRYEGVYLLTERPELGDGRIAAAGRGVTGAYLVEWTFQFQARRKGPHFMLPRSGRPILYEDPELADLSAAEARYLREYLRRTERAVYAGRGAWRRFLDEPSTIDYLLVQELFRNVDAFLGSTFLLKEAGRKLRFGPVWDFDLSTGNARYANSESTLGWWTRSRPWIAQLWRDCRFRARVGERWRRLQRVGLRRGVLARLDHYARVLEAGPAGRNFRRWPTLHRRLYQSPGPPRGSYRAEVRHLRGWLIRRMAWIDRAAGRLRC